MEMENDNTGGRMNPTQVQKFLNGVDYPASKSDIITNAQKEGADEKVMSMLQRLPEQNFQTPTDVSEALRQL